MSYSRVYYSIGVDSSEMTAMGKLFTRQCDAVRNVFRIFIYCALPLLLVNWYTTPFCRFFSHFFNIADSFIPQRFRLVYFIYMCTIVLQRVLILNLLCTILYNYCQYLLKYFSVYNFPKSQTSFYKS